MKFQSSQYSFYTYLRVPSNENFTECAKKLIKYMKKMGFKWDYDHDICILEPSDTFTNGDMGSPMYFIKNIKFKL